MAPDSNIEISPSSITGTLPKACLDLCSGDFRPSFVKGSTSKSYSILSSSRSHATRPALVPGVKYSFIIVITPYFFTIF